MSHFRKHIFSILLTNRCNLACQYCITSSSNLQPLEIDSKFAMAGIDHFFESTPSRWIRFYSAGETTTAFFKMVELTEYARRKAGSALTVEVQTNGFFNSNILSWFIENVDLTFISFDGLPDVHDKYRKTRDGQPSSPTILKNVHMLRSNQRMVGVRVTITIDNLYRQIEMIDFLSDLGVSCIFSKPVLPPVGASASITKEVPIMEYAVQYLDAFRYADKKGLFYGSGLVTGFDEKSIHYCRSDIPAPHLTPDGYVSCCDRAFSGGTRLKDLLYGKWNDATQCIEYQQEKIDKIRSRSLPNMTECQSCDVGPYCCGNCMGTAYQKTGMLMGITKEYCEAIRYLYKEMQWNRGLFPYFHP